MTRDPTTILPATVLPAAILFDLDGTLIDSTAPIVTSTQAALKELGWPPLDEAVIRAHIGYKLEAVFPDRSTDECARLIVAIGRHYDAICAIQTRLFPGIEPMLRRLTEASIPLAVVTSKQRHHTTQILAALGIDGYFSVCVSSDDVTHMKPHPEGIHAAARTLGASLDRCVYVGDTRVDVAAAQQAGVTMVAVAWGTDSVADLSDAGADRVVENMAELSRYLRVIGTSETSNGE